MSKKKRNKFANIIIAVCILAAVIITMATIYEYHRLDTVMPADVVTALLMLWGGELLIIALRQIFGSDAIAKRKSHYTEDESI